MPLRWRICALLFFATTVNYIDRNVLSFTAIDASFRKEMLGMPQEAELTQPDIDAFKKKMGRVDAAFKFAYAFGFIFAGWLIDRLGTRMGFSISIFVWSIAGVMNGFVGSLRGLSITRALLGVGESGNFPSAIKAVAEWFPKGERSFATGIFNAGANIGIILTALAVPYLVMHHGWRAAFISTGLLGFAVLALWLWMYRKPAEHPHITPAELAHIRDDGEQQSSSKDQRNQLISGIPNKSGQVSDSDNTPQLSWWQLLRYRQTWVFAVCKMLADPIWYFYLFWLPDFFNSNEALSQKLDLKNIGIPFIIIYLVSDAGSVFFGWLSSHLIRAGWQVHAARKLAMLVCGLCVAPIVFASVTSSIYMAVALIALATAAHQGWSANVFTLASDMFPKNTVASVVGIGSMFGALSGALFAAYCGDIRVEFGYVPLFIIAGSAYLVALLIAHLLLPKMEPVDWDS